MGRTEILEEIQLIQQIVMISDNVLVRNKLEVLKMAIIDEWNENDKEWLNIISEIQVKCI